MRHLDLISWAAVGLVVMFVSACTSTPTAIATEAILPKMTPTDTPGPTMEATVQTENKIEAFDPSNFDDPTNINNPWLPLKPGTQYIYSGVADERGETKEQKVILTVTDLTKVIDGVSTMVIWTEDYSGGALVKNELIFYAQDNDGKVWRMGYYPELFENNRLYEAPAWISGIKGSKAGIKMASDPRTETGSTSQGWGPSVGNTDRWRVLQVDQQMCVPVDCFEGVLVIAEFSPAEPDAIHLKYYAAGVGTIKVGWEGLDATRRALELVEIVQLSPEALAEARAGALELEVNAYKISKEVYTQTSPSIGP